LKGGDVVEIGLSDGSSHEYRVTSAVDYAMASIDMGAILKGREGVESITLMTCSGLPDEGEYQSRTVVLCERAD
jgi:sortase (surface protein transpeptidase)